MKRNRGAVLLPQPIEEEAVALLRENGLEIVQAPDAKPQTVAPLMSKAKAVILRTGITITRELLQSADDLWMISRTGGGVDNVDVEAATERDILVTSSLGVNTGSVVEHCLALITASFKQLFRLDREVRKSNFGIRYRNLPQDLQGKTLGIVGFGRIGSTLANHCRNIFAMTVLAYDRYLSPQARQAVASWVRFTSLDNLFRESDVVSIHLPLTKETNGLVDWERLSSMKASAFLINTSRGEVIREADLVRALKQGVIAGAGLDVFEKEPPSADNPLLGLENLILTPHSAALTGECVVRMAVSAAARVIDLFNGFVPENVANPEVLSTEKWGHLREK